MSPINDGFFLSRGRVLYRLIDQSVLQWGQFFSHLCLQKAEFHLLVSWSLSWCGHAINSAGDDVC